jgi:NAD(P)H-quinone oxidoreductase subunit 5
MNFTELTKTCKVMAWHIESTLIMITHPADWATLPLWQTALLLAPAVLAGAVALLAGRSDPQGSSVDGSTRRTAATWRWARWASAAGLAFAAVSTAVVLFGMSGSRFGLRADIVGALMSLLVAFVGWVIVRYSQPYLDGELAQRHYVRWLMATLAAVGVVVTTNHLAVLVLAWMATSMALHRLLTFFSDRPAAVVAAHKKFIVGRAADLCMLGAGVLFAVSFQTLHIDQIMARAAADDHLTSAAQAGVLLVVMAALLKCAQLPFHGWLIQVMEAPTPVSALLHAGIVNLGGFVLIRFAPLVSEVPAAQALLVAAGTATAVLAALVMTTRISVKVMLAWSTCAQMGFMLMQCGLGAWDMALLHLLAHSLYKAHAFLSAGGAVRRAAVAQMTARSDELGFAGWVVGILVGISMTLAAKLAWGVVMPGMTLSPALWVLSGIVALALVPLVHGQSPRLGGWWLASLMLGAFGVSFAYVGLHLLFSTWVLPTTAQPPAVLWIAVAVAFVLLFAVQSLIRIAPSSALVRGLYPWFYGGLFLDEKFNNIAFRVWPPPAPQPRIALALASRTWNSHEQTR